MEFLNDIWPVIVIVIGTLAGFLGTKSWWPYIQFGKEVVDIFAKLKIIDKDGVRTDQEKIEFADEVLQAFDATKGFKKKVANKQ